MVAADLGWGRLFALFFHKPLNRSSQSRKLRLSGHAGGCSFKGIILIMLCLGLRTCISGIGKVTFGNHFIRRHVEFGFHKGRFSANCLIHVLITSTFLL